MSVSPARRAAFEVVRRVFEDDAYADRVLRSASEGLDERERAFARRLAYGTVQRVRTLDHAIDTLGRRPTRKLDPPVLAALRLGAYQLGYLDVAPHAAANESVELVRAARLERAVPFTNAVMRRLAEGMEPLLAALPEGPLKHSYPDWIYDVWVRDFGEDEALALMRVQNEPPETVVRLVRGEIDGEPTDVPGAFRVARVDERGACGRTRLAAEPRLATRGARRRFARRRARSRLLCRAGREGDDAARRRRRRRDQRGARARAGGERARLGATNVRVVRADATELPPELDGFDRALVDAPCSGLGVLASRPDLRWRATPLPELQLALLRAAAERVKPGGTIVYSVCTLNADENETVVDASGLEIDPTLGDEWPQFRHPRRPEFLLTLPHVHGTSGFFIARLRR